MSDIGPLAAGFVVGWVVGALGAIHLYETGEMEPSTVTTMEAGGRDE